MKHKNVILASMVAGIISAGSISPAFAVVDLTEPTDFPSNDAAKSEQNPSRWAKEINAEKNSVLFSGATQPTGTSFSGNAPIAIDGKLAIKVKLGGLINAGESKFLRLDLDNGATFSTNPFAYARDKDGKLHSDGAGTPNAKEHTVKLKSGGTGSSFAVFEYVATTGAVNATTEDTVTFFFGSAYTETTTGVMTNTFASNATVTPNAGIKIANTDNDINVTYTLHKSQASADTGASGNEKLLTLTAKYIEFSPSIGFTAEAQPAPLTADVQENFTRFEGGVTQGSLTKIAYFLKKPRATALQSSSAFIGATQLINDTTGNKAVTLADLVNTTTKIDIAGNFSMVQDVVSNQATGTYNNAKPRVFLNTQSDCNGTSIAASTVTADAVSFEVGSTTPTTDSTTTSGAPSSPQYLCVNANGVTPIEKGEYSVGLTAVPKDGYTVANVDPILAVGAIKQNGTILDTPYITLTAGYVSRVYLSNNSNIDAKYTTVMVTDDGSTITTGAAATGTLAANSSTILQTADLITAFSTKKRGAIRFTIAAPNKKIQGVYQTVNQSSFMTQSIPLMRPGGGNGQ